MSALFVGCDGNVDDLDNVPICNPGATEMCTCNTGGPGKRICHSNGLAYGPCRCEELAVDAGVDASSITNAMNDENHEPTKHPPAR